VHSAAAVAWLGSVVERSCRLVAVSDGFPSMPAPEAVGMPL
jgi:hypothetical protein